MAGMPKSPEPVPVDERISRRLLVGSVRVGCVPGVINPDTAHSSCRDAPPAVYGHAWKHDSPRGISSRSNPPASLQNLISGPSRSLPQSTNRVESPYDVVGSYQGPKPAPKVMPLIIFFNQLMNFSNQSSHAPRCCNRPIYAETRVVL